jgi:hypothetical protein
MPITTTLDIPTPGTMVSNDESFKVGWEQAHKNIKAVILAMSFNIFIFSVCRTFMLGVSRARGDTPEHVVGSNLSGFCLFDPTTTNGRE